MIRKTIACGAVTTLTGVAGLLIREYLVYNGFFELIETQSNVKLQTITHQFTCIMHPPFLLYPAFSFQWQLFCVLPQLNHALLLYKGKENYKLNLNKSQLTSTRPPINHPDDVSEPSMTPPISPIMPSPRSPIIRKIPLKPLDKKWLFSITDHQMEAYAKARPER